MKRALLLAVCLLLLLSLAQAQDEVYKDPSADIEARVEDLLARMTFREKVGQMVMDMENPVLNEANIDGIGAYLIGGTYC